MLRGEAGDGGSERLFELHAAISTHRRWHGYSDI